MFSPQLGLCIKKDLISYYFDLILKAYNTFFFLSFKHISVLVEKGSLQINTLMCDF